MSRRDRLPQLRFATHIPREVSIRNRIAVFILLPLLSNAIKNHDIERCSVLGLAWSLGRPKDRSAMFRLKIRESSIDQITRIICQ